MDKYFREDIINVIKNCPYLNDLNSKTILITGATGLIGSTLIKTIIEYNKIANCNISIIAFIRNKEKANAVLGDYVNDKNLKLYINDITGEINIEENIDFIIHAAAITKSLILVNRPVETAMTAILGTKNILELAKEKKIKSMVYISSMEIYGTFETNDAITEDELGYINLKNIRNGYPESKRMCEFLCNAYYNEYGVSVKSARLAQTFGAGIPIDDTRIFAEVAKSVILNKNIILHTMGKSEANYCYISDVIVAILTILIKGVNGESYNVANENCHTTISEMAEMVCKKIAKDKIKVIYDIPEDVSVNGYAPDTKLKLSSKKLRELGWNPQYDLEESYNRLILSYRERMK